MQLGRIAFENSLYSTPLFQITIKEEDRLASVISEINDDVRIVPRGAFMKTPTGQVVTNRSFEGK